MRIKSVIVFLALSLLLILSNTGMATPLVGYTYSGTAGNYMLDFSITNNIDASYDQYLYFWGVDIDNVTSFGSPQGWNRWDNTWNNSANGGSAIDYQYNWLVSDFPNDYRSYGIAPSATLSGFTLTTAVLPEVVNFYVYAYTGSNYDGADSFNQGTNPGFEGIVSNVIDPVPEPATFLLLGSGLAGLAFYRRKKK